MRKSGSSDLEKVMFSRNLRDAGQFSGLRVVPRCSMFFPGLLCDSRETISPLLPQGNHVFTTKEVGTRRCKLEMQSDTGNQKLHFVLEVGTTPCPPR